MMTQRSHQCCLQAQQAAVELQTPLYMLAANEPDLIPSRDEGVVGEGA